MRIIYLLIILLVYSHEASAGQIYFGASGGWAFGSRFSQYENFTCRTSNFGACSEKTTNLEGSGVDGEDSNAWGLKAGYYLTSVPWLGFEINYYQRNQRVQRQPFTATGTNPTSMFPTLPFSGQIEMEFESIKNFIFQVVVRPKDEWVEKYLFNSIEPYAGLGAGFIFTKLGPVRIYDNLGNLVSTNVDDDGGSGPALLVTLGLNYKITDSILFYGEYKWTWGPLAFKTLDFPGQTDMNYLDHIFMLGLTYRFNVGSDLFEKEQVGGENKLCQDPVTHAYYPC